MSDTAQLSPQQADRFWKGKPTRNEVQGVLTKIQERLNQFDLLLSYLAEKAGVTPQTLNDWLAEKAKPTEVKDEVPAA